MLHIAPLNSTSNNNNNNKRPKFNWDVYLVSLSLLFPDNLHHFVEEHPDFAHTYLQFRNHWNVSCVRPVVSSIGQIHKKEDWLMDLRLFTTLPALSFSSIVSPNTAARLPPLCLLTEIREMWLRDESMDSCRAVQHGYNETDGKTFWHVRSKPNEDHVSLNCRHFPLNLFLLLFWDCDMI